MAMVYKAVTGRVTIPGTDIAPGGRLKVTATPMSTDTALAFAGERATFGPRSVETDSAGNLPTGTAALRIPQDSSLGADLLWEITAEPIEPWSGLPKWTVAVTTITADTTIQELAHPDVTMVTPTLATTVGENAAAAATSATNAATSETNAASSATAAASSASVAATSATNAATSETNAAASASSASTSAGTATTKAGEASTSAGNAATSASNAATSASTATTKASEAATSASNAASSAASVPGMWQPSTVYTAGSVKVAPDGSHISRNADGTSRATFDATEQAAWTVVAAKAGTLENTALTATYAPIVDGAGKGIVRKDTLFVNVKDHGAVGDGSTDDTAAIQAAITAANWPTTRATIFFPPGNYLISSAISINGGGATSTPQLDILGFGAKLTTATAGITMLDITNSAISLTRVRVRGLQMLVNAASTGIRLNNAEFCVLSEIDFLGSFGLAVKIEGTSTYNTIKDCTFSNLSRGIYLPGGSAYLSIIGCHFGEQTAGSPLNWIQADTAQTANVSITNCTFYGEGNTLPAVNIVQGIGWTITGCKFAYCTDVALFIGSDGTSYGHMVTGNVFDHNAKDDIKINGGRLNTIAGNYFGIRKAGTPASTYCNVTILNTFGGTAGSDNTVVGNTSVATGTALLASFSAAAACQNVAFIGNQYAIATVNTNTSGLIVGRDGIQIPTGKDITRSGYSIPGVLARVTGIDAKTAAATTLYTVPTGKTAVITGAVVQSGAVTAITAGPTLGIGIAAGEDDIYPSTALTGLTSNLKTFLFPAPGLMASAPAGSVIKVGIDAASTGTSQTVSVTLIGFLL